VRQLEGHAVLLYRGRSGAAGQKAPVPAPSGRRPPRSAGSHVVPITVVKYRGAIAEVAGLVCDFVGAADRGVRPVGSAGLGELNGSCPAFGVTVRRGRRKHVSERADHARDHTDIRRVRNTIGLSMEPSIAVAAASPRRRHRLERVAPLPSSQCEVDHTVPPAQAFRANRQLVVSGGHECMPPKDSHPGSRARARAMDKEHSDMARVRVRGA
jgi:hypothetical protein